MSTEDNANVSFTNDVEVEEAAPVEAASNGRELSQSDKAWDINGDGKLSNTEKALKDLDKTGKGTLSKDQMYQLMHQNMALQKDLSRVKKFVIGLAVITVLLALANVGVSFAAAYLAKDTETEGSVLVVTKTGETVKTDSTTTVFEVETAPSDEARRHLLSIYCDEDTKPYCGFIPWGHCQSAISQCRAGGGVSLQFQGGDDTYRIQLWCPLPFGYYMKTNAGNTGLYTYKDDDTLQGSLTPAPNANGCLVYYYLPGAPSEGVEG